MTNTPNSTGAKISAEEMQKIIQNDRATRISESWDGKFLEYLDKVRDDSTIAKLSHARVHDVIMASGSKDILEKADDLTKRLFKDEPIRAYNFFVEEFFGIEKTIAQIVRYLSALFALE